MSSVTTSMFTLKNSNDFENKSTNSNKDTEVIFKKNIPNKISLKRSLTIDIKPLEEKKIINIEKVLERYNEKPGEIPKKKSILKNSKNSSDSLKRIFSKSVRFIDEVLEEENEANEENENLKTKEINLTTKSENFNKKSVKLNLDNKEEFQIPINETSNNKESMRSSKKQLAEVIFVPSLKSMKYFERENISDTQKENFNKNSEDKVQCKCCIIF